ncbi:hypothetical protein ED312_14595 [Sinomicrobium pectinilyticum]|uniref:Uncharacterized protein n=1 Tax=Sinomicrobium pectinilyticum TaxID=1084421 RepID=A0A3N0E7F4_SINP1|nr:hypothetical protein [Sinomicrobium pectinilyticum]RNL83710.1 hypothetical protein ED312_14595 [Sinomicrobium pectinilyticum]
MKKNYLAILSLLCLLGYTPLSAQYKQYEESSVEDVSPLMEPGAVAAAEEPFNHTIKFTAINDLIALDNAMRAAHQKALKAWLSKQESTLEKSIESTLNKNFNGFKDAQKAMFKAYEERTMRTKYKAADLAANYHKKSFDEGRSRDNYTSELLLLKQRKAEINSGKVNQSSIGSFKVQGVKLKDIKTIAKHDEIRKKSVASFGKHHLESTKNSSIEKGLMKVGWDSNILVDKLVQDRVSHYKSRSLQDKIGLMTAYIISYNTQSILQYPSVLTRYQIPNYATNSYMLQIGNKNAPKISEAIKAFDPEYELEMIRRAAQGYLGHLRPEHVAKMFEANREKEIARIMGNPPSSAAITLSELAEFDEYLKSGNFNPLNSPWLKRAREYAEKVYKLKDKVPDYAEKEMIEAVDNSFIFALKKTALYMNPKANITSETEKQKQFKVNGKNGVAILLYEFATGTGKDNRDFPFDYDMTKQMLAGQVPSDIKKDFLSILHDKKLTFEEFVKSGNTILGSYSFSPDHTTVKDSFNKHIKANWVQFFIGGASIDYTPSDEEGWINVELTNPTSRNSLLLHIAESYKRTGNGKNKPLSTITQTFKFKLKIK